MSSLFFPPAQKKTCFWISDFFYRTEQPRHKMCFWSKVKLKKGLHFMTHGFIISSEKRFFLASYFAHKKFFFFLLESLFFDPQNKSFIFLRKPELHATSLLQSIFFGRWDKKKDKHVCVHLYISMYFMEHDGAWMSQVFFFFGVVLQVNFVCTLGQTLHLFHFHSVFFQQESARKKKNESETKKKFEFAPKKGLFLEKKKIKKGKMIKFSHKELIFRCYFFGQLPLFFFFRNKKKEKRKETIFWTRWSLHFFFCSIQTKKLSAFHYFCFWWSDGEVFIFFWLLWTFPYYFMEVPAIFFFFWGYRETTLMDHFHRILLQVLQEHAKIWILIRFCSVVNFIIDVVVEEGRGGHIMRTILTPKIY